MAKRGGSKSNFYLLHIFFLKQPPKKTDQISHEKKHTSQSFLFIGMLMGIWDSIIFKLSFLLVPIGSMGLVYLPTWMVDFYGFHVGKYTSPMDTMGYPTWHMQFCSTPVLCLKTFRLPKAAGPTHRGIFPLPGAHPGSSKLS